MSRRRGAPPTHRGLPVPWVVRRKTPGESDQRAVKGGQIRLARDRGQPCLAESRIEIPGWFRDPHGFLWFPGREDGEPQFSEVNPARHRRCMDEGRCQVCGDRKHNLRWLVPISPLERGTIKTAHAPVCAACEDIARRFCPHLRRYEWAAVFPARVKAWGVLGTVLNLRGEVASGSQEVPTGHELVGLTIAKQRIVTLHEWTS